MTDISDKDYCLARIRQKLKEDGVKLWEAPFYVNNQTSDSSFEELAFNISDVLSLPQEMVLASLKELQFNALEKLSSRSQFQETGLATLKIKLIGTNHPLQTITINLNETGESLKRSINSSIKSTKAPRFKMICHGILINDHEPLHSQRVSNNSRVLVISLPSDPNQHIVEEEMFREIEMIKADAELLAAEEDRNYLQIADQSGNVLKLPMEEKKSLAIAMALHEKGRVALKQNQISLALTFFYEADSSFSGCRAEILKAVDNAGLLNLDIAWCYLLLGNAADISDAAIRLETCEQVLNRSYGPKMERLLELKGTTGNEAVLFLRLHLLQGVVAFHQGKSLEATRIFNSAEEELKKATVNDEDLTRLLDLGYSMKDAKLSLRACGGHLNDACIFLQRREEEKMERKRKEKEEEERKIKRKKLGKTASGQWVNLGYLETIVDMGFNRIRSVEALKRTNNDISRAIEVLQEELETGIDFADNFDDAGIAQIASLGVPVETAGEILASYGGNVDRAIKELQSPNPDPDTEDASGSSETASTTKKEAEAAFERFAKDLPTSHEDHLDTNLELEREYLLKYLSFLKGP